MSLVTDDNRRLSELLRHLKPVMDKTVGDIKPVDKHNTLLKRDVQADHPMIPNLVNLTDEERRRFQDSVGMMYLANLVNFTVRIFDAISQGEFLDAINTADMIWVAYPDLAPFLDQDPPSEVIRQRENDFVNYKWSDYTEADDQVMLSSERRYHVTNEMVAELTATRERAIEREYIMFEFIGKVHLGMRELGWLLSEENRLSIGGPAQTYLPEPAETSTDESEEDS